MPSTSNRLEIYNMALGFIGTRTVGSPNERTPEAQPEGLAEDGTVGQPAVQGGDAYSLRYDEALCLEAAYQRRRADRLEARIAALEAVLNGND